MPSDLPYNAKDKGESDDTSDDELLPEMVPYSSSSVDRSSIGSIPWADDAIKQNRLDWERVERMLSGEESLPQAEPELRNEILEWQRKFPELLGKQQPKKHLLRQQTQTSLDGTLDLDEISNLSLNSIDDVEIDGTGCYNDDDDSHTPGNQWAPQTPTQKHPSSDEFQNEVGTVTHLLERDLCISSIPVTLRKRQLRYAKPVKTSTDESRRSSEDSTHHTRQLQRSRLGESSPVSKSPQQPVRRLRMPPILNVLESRRRFRGLANDRSFVQLTQVQQQPPPQPKSAVVSLQQQQSQTIASATTLNMRNKSAWHVPLAAAKVANNRFFNSRNAIILPAINLQRIGVHHATGVQHATATTTTASDGGDGTRTQHRAYQFVPHHNFNCASSSTLTTTPSTTGAGGGRSISAAVHSSNFRAFYLPYTTKFKSFK